MALLRWQWTLANGGIVVAVLDVERGVEAVWQGDRVLSERPRGALADGHAVVVAPAARPDGSVRPSVEAVVTFDPRAPICVLRVDGHEVAPSAWPVRARRTAPVRPARAWGAHLVTLVLLAALIAAGVFLVAMKGKPSTPEDPLLRGTHRAPSGLFIAHFPGELTPKDALLPSGVSGLVLEDAPVTLTLVLAAAPSAMGLRDPWLLQQRLRDEALANVPKGLARFEETSRVEETCLGERGAVVTGQLAHGSVRRARVWSCAFVHDGAAYFMLYALEEPASAETERRARAILDATELTRLADVGPPPETLH